MDIERLAYQSVKYKQRNGWSHRDLLRLSHPSTEEEGRNSLFHWIVGKGDSGHPLVDAVEEAKTATAKETIRLIETHGLTREMVSPEHLSDADVWSALLRRMPMTAMIRNLGKMSQVGLLAAHSDAAVTVAERLRDEDRIRKARVHPVQMLSAQRTYASGSGFRGSLRWTAVPSVVDALDDAFYLSFVNAESTGKRFYLGVDVSASMGWHASRLMGGSLLASEGAAAMAMTIVQSERDPIVRGFCGSMVDLGFTKKTRIDDALARTAAATFGPTDCSIPMLDALNAGLKVDCFVVLTDNETWYGDIHPSQALDQYRSQTGIPAKMVVVGMTSTGFTIADPRDAGMIDVVGFDSAVPKLISDFVSS